MKNPVIIPTPENAEALLGSLRWKADTLVTNYFGEVVWLKPCYLNGKRIGITDCCFVDDPCERHKDFSHSPESEEGP